MNHYDVVILGGGISGYMAAKRLYMLQPELSIAMIDKGMETSIHPFHLHKPIPEIPEVAKIAPQIMHTNIWNGACFKKEPTLLDINKYSWKIFGSLQISNISQQGTIPIYPIEKQTLKELFDSRALLLKGKVEEINIKEKIVTWNGAEIKYNNIISTIPLPELLKMLKVEVNFEFQNFPFYSAKYKGIAENLYQMIYNTDWRCNITRSTLLGETLFIESKFAEYTEKDKEFLEKLYNINCLELMTLISPGRIKPLSAENRKPLLHWLTEKHNIMTLGRYGAWTFKVANDVWEDTKFISDIIYAKQQAYNFENGGRK